MNKIENQEVREYTTDKRVKYLESVRGEHFKKQITRAKEQTKPRRKLVGCSIKDVILYNEQCPIQGFPRNKDNNWMVDEELKEIVVKEMDKRF